ncbi:hypothetical protein L9F63_003130 [Diploptera punctata]|uniref:Cysteine dioxygenase n=1 Tax=Diploptera punctata TaxID=6984 RepID=A0AAD7ZLD7_DIPPU|nr:hypothetical protein L9F63_003130 [Diploptera punctata]
MDVEVTRQNYINTYNDVSGLKIKTPTITTLNDLVRELHNVFASDTVNIEYVHQLMTNYKSNPADWRKYAKFDRFRYTRNLVDEGNGKFNLMILCWGEGHGSGIHDHANAHCFMKVLKGNLSEIRFEYPKEKSSSMTDTTDSEDEENGGLKEISRSRLESNEVCYINDSLGLHRIENPSNIDTAVSLHLYCPPFDTCHVFNQRTRQATPCKVTFWSKFGEKRNRDIQSSRDPEDN